MHLLARLVRNVKRPLDDNLHLVVRIRIHERRALFKTVEARRERLF